MTLGWALLRSQQPVEMTAVQEGAFVPFNLEALKKWKMQEAEDRAIRDAKIVPLNMDALKSWKEKQALNAKTLAAMDDVQDAANTGEELAKAVNG